MRRLNLALLTLAVTGVGIGCVIRTHHTIEAHVTVDIRQVEEQAEDIVSYVKGETDALPETPAPVEPKKTSFLEDAWRCVAPLQVAYAAELKQSSPRVKELADKMRKRNGDLQENKAKAYVGETNRGYVEVLSSDELKKDTERKNAVQKLVAAENADRKALYQEIAQLNKEEGVTLSVVERVFADKWLKQARSGEHVQLPPAGQAFDEFKQSAIGKKLGEDAKPGAWVTIK